MATHRHGPSLRRRPVSRRTAAVVVLVAPPVLMGAVDRLGSTSALGLAGGIVGLWVVVGAIGQLARRGVMLTPPQMARDLARDREREIAACMAECRNRPVPGPARRLIAGWLRGLADRLAGADEGGACTPSPRARP